MRAGVPELGMHRLDWEFAQRILRNEVEADAESDRWIERNGLRVQSQIAIDRPQTVQRPKLGATIGRLDADATLAVDRVLAVFLGLAQRPPDHPTIHCDRSSPRPARLRISAAVPNVQASH